MHKVYITGFGKFNGVDNNPSQEIVKRLTSNNDVDITTEILEVSIEGCRASNVYQHQKDICDNECIYIHLGVDSSSTCYKLEQYGYNLCHFRCPDEQNNQPMRTPINDTKKLDESLYTCLPLKMIQETLTVEGYNVEGKKKCIKLSL